MKSPHLFSMLLRFSVSFFFVALPGSHVMAQALSVLVPYAAGGPSDVAIRELARGMSESYPAGVNVENRLGQQGLLGLREYASSPSNDAKLIAIGSGTFFVAAAREPNLLNSIRPVSLLAIKPFVLIAPNSFQEFARQVSAQGELRIGISGPGTISHLCAAQLARAMRVPLAATNDIYKGTAPLLQDLISKKQEHACLELTGISRLIKESRITAVAVSIPEGQKHLPGVPTFESLGLNGVTVGEWTFLAFRVGTPDDVINQTSEAIRKALSRNASRLELDFVPPDMASPQVATSFIQREHERMKPFFPIVPR